MIITCETYIDAPVEITVELFADRRNLKKGNDIAVGGNFFL